MPTVMKHKPYKANQDLERLSLMHAKLQAKAELLEAQHRRLVVQVQVLESCCDALHCLRTGLVHSGWLSGLECSGVWLPEELQLLEELQQHQQQWQQQQQQQQQQGCTPLSMPEQCSQKHNTGQYLQQQRQQRPKQQTCSMASAAANGLAHLLQQQHGPLQGEICGPVVEQKPQQQHFEQQQWAGPSASQASVAVQAVPAGNRSSLDSAACHVKLGAITPSPPLSVTAGAVLGTGAAAGSGSAVHEPTQHMYLTAPGDLLGGLRWSLSQPPYHNAACMTLEAFVDYYSALARDLTLNMALAERQGLPHDICVSSSQQALQNLQQLARHHLHVINSILLLNPDDLLHKVRVLNFETLEITDTPGMAWERMCWLADQLELTEEQQHTVIAGTDLFKRLLDSARLERQQLSAQCSQQVGLRLASGRALDLQQEQDTAKRLQMGMLGQVLISKAATQHNTPPSAGNQAQQQEATRREQQKPAV